MSSIDDLQAAVSRFAPVAGFGSVAATSTVDAGTVAAVQSALTWIQAHVPTESDNATRLMSNLTTALQITGSAAGLGAYFDQIADAQNLGGTNLSIPILPGPLKSIPNWVVYLAASAVLLGVAVLVVKHKSKRSLRPAMAGFDALDHGYDDVEDAEYVDVD